MTNLYIDICNNSWIFYKTFVYQVSGFSVMGRIISQQVNGKPISGLKVILNKEKTSETNKDGTFIFESVKSGIHNIQVKAGNF